MRRRAKCKWWLDFSTKWYSKKPYTPFSQSYELGCFSSMFVVVVVVACLSVYLFVWFFECFYVWLACWLDGLFVKIVCFFDCFVCLFESLIVCLLFNGEDSITHFATSVNHKSQCKISTLLEACLMEELVFRFSFLFAGVSCFVQFWSTYFLHPFCELWVCWLQHLEGKRTKLNCNYCKLCPMWMGG